MVAALSRTAQLKIQQALAQWRHWNTSKPLEIQPAVKCTLEGGISNTSVLVSSGENAFVVRLDGQNPQRLGLSRAAEWRAHQNAAARQLAPLPVYFNPELGILVSEFLERDKTPLAKHQELAAIAQLLRGIHSLPAVKFRLQPVARAAHYQGLLGDKSPGEEFMEACSRLRHPARTCLCHNDLLRDNRLQVGGRLRAIDWEYSAMGDPWFDLAAICEGDQLSELECRQLSEAYLQAAPDQEQQQWLQDNRLVYRHLTQMWMRITGL